MARPSAYSRGRRIVMQVTMSGVFLATLGLAALVARSRERAAAVELETKPHLTDHLAIRLPKGWPLSQDSLELPVEVVARERVVGKPEKSRDLTVYQTDTPPGSAVALLQQYIGSTPGVLGEPDAFMILGEPGVIASFDRTDPDEFGYAPSRYLPGWYAAGVLAGKGPKGGDLGVVIRVEGITTAGPAGRRLVRQVADGLALRGNTPR